MQRYGLKMTEGIFLISPMETGSYYAAADADARIEQLEKALRSCVFAFNKEIQAAKSFSEILSEALEEAHKALAVEVKP